MKDFGKRIAEVEYILKQMDSQYINKLPQNLIDYISEEKDYEYSQEFCNNKSINMESLHVNTVAILTYINMNYFLEEKEKEELSLLLKNTNVDIEKIKKTKYRYEDLFKNKKNNKTNNVKTDEQLIEYKKQNWLKKIFDKIKSFF